MKKLFLIIVFGGLLFAALKAQTAIDFKLPEAAGFDYCFVLEKGLAQDTVAHGTFDSEGNARVLLPPEYAEHRGAGKLFLTGAKNPMVNMILNSEKEVTVGGKADNPVYGNSPENETLQRFIRQQNELLQQYIAVLGNLETGIGSIMIEDAQKRQLEKDYETLSAEITSTPLYAGKIMQILRYLTFKGSSLGQTSEAVREELNNFFVNELDFNDLYVSGFWRLMFDVWYENNMTSGDSLLAADVRTMLGRVGIEHGRELSQSIINVFSRYSNKEYLLPAIFSDIKYPVLGQAAPALVNGTDSIAPRNALILFYESDCGSCQNELHELIEKYALFQDNKIRIFSISADMDKDLFEYMAQKIPWRDNYSDFKGFDGMNFVNYGIFGTPAFILIDHEGIVRGRYARMSEIVKSTQ